MISCVVVFDCRLTRIVYDDSHPRLLGSCVKFNQTAVLVLKLISKLRNSRRNGKIDLSCISMWDGTGLHYCQQIVACPSSKRFVKALVLVNMSEFILLKYYVLLPQLCIRLRNILCKWFVTTVLTQSPTCPATNLVRIFCNDSEESLWCISALCSGRANISISRVLIGSLELKIGS